MATLTKNVSVKILTGTNRINPVTETSDWNSKTAEVVLDGVLKSIKFEEPTPKINKEYFVGSDTSGTQYSISFIDEWENGKLSGSMLINPTKDGNYLEIDKYFLKSIATATDVENFQYGDAKTNDADLLVSLGSTKGVRVLFKGFRVNKLNAFDVQDKGLVMVEFEFESLDEGSVYKQIRK